MGQGNGLVASLALALRGQVRDELGRRAREAWTPFRGSGTEAPETKGQETASLVLSRSQKKDQTGIPGYRLGKLGPKKREGRAQAPFQTGARPDSLLASGAGLSHVGS